MEQGRRQRIRGRRRTAGQALLLAVIVLLMLALLAASMVAVVAGSTRDTAGEEARSQARALAMAGVRFADEMLTNSSQGADWRPALPAYLTPGNAAYNTPAGVYDDNWDTFEKVRGWDPASIAQQTPTPPYFVKYRFAMDPDSLAQNPSVDPNQDFDDTPNTLEPRENDEVTAQHDHFLLRITYAPNAGDPNSRMIKIESIGRPGSSINTFNQLTAYKPVGIQQYGLYVHDMTRQADSAPVGVPPLDLTGTNNTQLNARTFSNPSPATLDGAWSESGANSYIPLLINGPVRTNLDLEVHPPVALTFVPSTAVDPTTGKPWTDGVEVAGNVVKKDADGQSGGNDSVLVQSAAGALVDYTPGMSGTTVYTNAPRLEAPTLDVTEPVTGVSRYDRLTKYSGNDVAIYPSAASAVPTTVNSGQLGYGQGIYLDNSTQIDQADVAKNTWLQPETWGGRHYVPNGALIELYDQGSYTFPDGTSGPAIVITRTDGSTWVNTATGRPSGNPTMVYYWPNKAGAAALPTFSATSGVPTTMPKPNNGVIVAEGNVRVRGRLPASSVGSDYHLTIVSRGTIYVDGPILEPSDTGTVTPAEAATYMNTHLALLARDNLVINPTAMAPGPVPGLVAAPFQTPRTGSKDACWDLNATGSNVIGMQFPSPASTANLQVTAELANADTSNSFKARAALVYANALSQLGQLPAVGGPVLLNDSTGGGVVTIPGMPSPPAAVSATNGIGVPALFTDWANLGNAIYNGNTTEYWPDQYGCSNLAQTGQPNWITVSCMDPSGTNPGQADVLLKNLKVEQVSGGAVAGPGLAMTVSALMFSERGTFFVIPGAGFDPRAQLQTDVVGTAPADPNAATAGYAAQRLARLKRYNYQVVINGALCVNSLSPLPDVGLWTDQWCYPGAQTQPGAGVFDDYAGVQYNYDWSLRAYWPAGSPRANMPLLPALPASPGLTYIGEESKS